MDGYIKFIQLNYRSTSINVIVYFLIILTLYVTSVKMATWLADTCSKANTFLHHVIFQEISPKKIRNAFTVYPMQSTYSHLRNILNFSTFAILGLSLAATYWPGHMIPRREVALHNSCCDRDTNCPQRFIDSCLTLLCIVMAL